MRAAYDFGADAVYAGQPRYSLRARNNEFRLEQIAQGIQEAHARGKKFFVTSNLIAHNDKVRTYLRDIEPVIACKPDAFIMADPGLIMMVKRKVARDRNPPPCRPTPPTTPRSSSGRRWASRASSFRAS
jgi:putative protease